MVQLQHQEPVQALWCYGCMHTLGPRCFGYVILAKLFSLVFVGLFVFKSNIFMNRVALVLKTAVYVKTLVQFWDHSKVQILPLQLLDFCHSFIQQTACEKLVLCTKHCTRYSGNLNSPSANNYNHRQHLLHTYQMKNTVNCSMNIHLVLTTAL